MNDADFTYYSSALHFLGIDFEEGAESLALEQIECNGYTCEIEIRAVVRDWLAAVVVRKVVKPDQANWTDAELDAFAARLTCSAIEQAETVLGCDTL